MKVLVTGAAGRLGGVVAREAAGAGHEVVALGRGDLDVTDRPAVDARVAAERPGALINCVAYNDVDGAESAPETAVSVNALGVLNLARAAARAGAAFVHYSTDFVFDGEADRPYRETDPPRPLNVYGQSKLLGEMFAADAAAHYVLRVESLFGGPLHGEGVWATSLGGIVRGIREGREVSVFADRTVSPSYAADVARATLAVIERRPAPGRYHCVNRGAATWEAIAREAARLLGADPRLVAVRAADVAMRARRPLYCALAADKLAAAGIEMRPWQDALGEWLSGADA